MASSVKVVYSDYDYQSHKANLKFGNAIIEKNGSAMIKLGMFGVIERRAGEYLMAEHFEHDWKMCLRERAEEIAKMMVEKGK